MTYLPNTPLEDNIFLPIPGHPSYMISVNGQVKNLKNGNILKHLVHRASCRWYVRCHLGLIHRLLASAMAGHELGTFDYVRHVNGNTFDNRPSNLRIGSPAQNARDRVTCNTNGRTLRNQDVREIRRLADRLTRHELAARYKVSPGHICKIQTRRAWANLP